MQQAGDAEEQAAIARLKRGEIEALEVLVRRFQLQALEAAYLVTRNYQMAEDVVQSSFVYAYELIDQFESGRAFGPWFLRSVVNRAITTARQNDRKGLLSSTAGSPEAASHDVEGWACCAADMQSPEPGVEEIVEAAETKEEILAALEKLSPVQKGAIVLRYYLDLSDDEVSRQFNIPPGTVRRRLHDARQRLRKLLAARII